jgi:galactokinase
MPLADPRALLAATFGPGPEPAFLSAPGRVNLIGEHIDYHGLPVLPIAIRRSIRVAFRPRADRIIRAVSASHGQREFEWSADLAPTTDGDWENYLRAAACAVARKWGAGRGMDAAIVSDLPPAAGLSSSSALIVAVTLSLLRANDRQPIFEELMEILPEGEHFVGTRGGGMDHAASLASRAGCASLIEFDPLAVHHVPIPPGWAFLVAHSLTVAEKSGAARGPYNARRAAGTAVLRHLGFASYHAVIAGRTLAELENLSAQLPSAEERDVFSHVTSEALRVRAAVTAMGQQNATAFGALLVESHASLRDRLQVSCPALDRLVAAAMESGALGARLTGAGFGGCAVVFCREPDLPAVRHGLIQRYYLGLPQFDETAHLIHAVPGPGALHADEAQRGGLFRAAIKDRNSADSSGADARFARIPQKDLDAPHT